MGRLYIEYDKRSEDYVLMYEHDEWTDALISRTGLLQKLKEQDYTQVLLQPFEAEAEKIDLRALEDLNNALAFIKIAGRISRLIPERDVAIKDIVKYLVALYYRLQDPAELKNIRGMPTPYMVLTDQKVSKLTFKDLELLYYMAIRGSVIKSPKARDIIAAFLNL